MKMTFWRYSTNVGLLVTVEATIWKTFIVCFLLVLLCYIIITFHTLYKLSTVVLPGSPSITLKCDATCRLLGLGDCPVLGDLVSTVVICNVV